MVLPGGAILGAIFFLWWNCSSNDSINFLSKHRGADWIVYPTPPDASAHWMAELSGEFRRVFVMSDVPSSATATFCAFKHCKIIVNGQSISTDGESNWKRPKRIDVSKYLRAGTNEISVTVSNRDGPPGLWLRLEAGKFALATDEKWDCSLAGAVWRRAALAREPREIRAGNLIFGGEQPAASFLARWPTLLLFTTVPAGILIVVFVFARKPVMLNFLTARPVASIVGTAALLWLALFINNIPVLPHLVGFDASSHLEYIQYIRTKWALPLPHEGFEMFQPPLYYALSALSVTVLSISNDGAFDVLRAMTFGIGVVHIAFIFLSLRLIFPNQLQKQIVGLLLAAFLPMHIYLSHFTTNETLAATLVTMTLYLTLRILRAEKVSERACKLLGLCLGAALLAKASALLVVPFVFVALAQKVFAARQTQREWLRLLALTIVACLAVCGWHYGRMWIQCGNPLIFNWDSGGGFAWWQENGYHMSGDFFRFGKSLASPLFSGFNGLPDGIYSTLWGDALIGGKSTMAFRPPWNYDLMAAGYLLALIPTALIVIGAARLLWKFLRAPDADGLLLGGFAAMVALAIAWMSLKVPSYAQIKAFYGLSALLPLAVFAGAGWEFIFARGKILRTVSLLLLGAWAINSYASFWICHNAPATHLANGLSKAREMRAQEALREFSQAVRIDPTNVAIRAFEADVLSLLGESDARGKIRQLVTEHPDSPIALVQAALILSESGDIEEALQYAGHAVRLAPEYALAQQLFCKLLLDLGRNDEVIATAPNALGVAPYNPSLHFNFGIALSRRGKIEDGIGQLRLASALQPSWFEAHLRLAEVLIQRGELDEAARHLSYALRLKPNDAEAQKLLELCRSKK